MPRRRIARCFSIVAAMAIVVLPHTAAAQPPVARVSVYGTHAGGQVAYHYRVHNDGRQPVRRFYIGCECRSLEDMGTPELQTLPLGARPVRMDDFGEWYEPMESAARQPPGWRMRILRPEGARSHWIEWSVPSAQNPGIRPGMSLAGFSVVTPGADATYLQARFAVHGTGDKAAFSGGPLLLADTTAPRLTLTADAETIARGESARVQVRAVATDDRDPEPRIAVVSIAPDEAPGDETAYVIVYSATDASGNRATASTRVRLPVVNRRTVTAANLQAPPSLP